VVFIHHEQRKIGISMREMDARGGWDVPNTLDHRKSQNSPNYSSRVKLL
jgi:hypothetical protein